MSGAAIKVGIIGGTGFGNFTCFKKREEKKVSTPYGEPSDVLLEGHIAGVPCTMLYRHGRPHFISPTNVNYRANVWALKDVGCTHILAITSCGGLQDRIKPGDAIVLDQFFDRTTKRHLTFYDGQPGSPKGIQHITMEKPFCEKTRQVLIKACQNVSAPFHDKGTVVTIEGSRFSSKFESKYFHQLGIDVVNMTTVPEVILAKELGLCYASLAMSTDDDSWRDDAVGVDCVGALDVAKSNAKVINEVIAEAVSILGQHEWTDVINSHKEIARTSIL